MCGIIGLISNDEVIDFLINGLKQLQNRGYDSAGIATYNKENIIHKKYASTEKVNALFMYSYFGEIFEEQILTRKTYF